MLAPLQKRRSRPAHALCVVLFGLFAFLLAVPSALATPPSPSGSASASSAAPGAPGAPGSVHIHDRQVFTIKVARAGQTAVERAGRVSQMLEHAADEPDDRVVRAAASGELVVVYLGDEPIIQLGPEDAASEGDASVADRAAVVSSKVTEALRAERRRSALATTVFSLSLLVFSALMAFLALGKLSEVVTRGRGWVASRPTSLPNIRVAGIDIVRPMALRGVVLVAIDGSKWLLGLGVGYAWLLFALSLFESTKQYSDRLSGFVLAPLSGLIGRLAAMMPVLFIGAVGTLALLLLLRFVALFFEGVARGEPTLSWLPADLAGPTSILIRIAIVLVGAAIATPLMTGNDDGPLARGSIVALAAIGLSITPVIASAGVGVTLLWSRRVKVGEFVEMGGRSGVVRAVQLLGVSLEDSLGCQVLVPHLANLLHPMRLLGALPPVSVEVSVTPTAPTESVSEVLTRAADEIGIRVRVELTRLDADEAMYTVTVMSSASSARSDLLTSIATRLRTADIPLGRPATRSTAT